MTNSSLQTRCMLTMAALLCCLGRARGEWTGDGELLKHIAEAHRANKERIATWSGAASVASSDLDGDQKNGVRNSAHVSFVYDRSMPALRWAWAYDSCVQIRNGVEHRVDLGRNEGIIKSDIFYKLDPGSDQQADGRHRFVIHPVDKAQRSQMSDNFDPLIYFAPDTGTIEQRFDGLYELWKKREDGGPGGWSISSDGELVTVATRRTVPDYGEILNRYRLNLARSCTLESYEGADPDGKHAIHSEFIEVDGVWVPSRFTMVVTRLNAGTTATHDVRWTKNIINQPLGENDFSLDGLGAREGDEVVDTRTGTRFTVQREEPRTPYEWFVEAIVVLALALCAVWLLRRRRLAGAQK